MLTEIMAKLTQNEKLIGIGARVCGRLAVGFILRASRTPVSSRATLVQRVRRHGHWPLAVLAAVAAIVVIYLKYAPNTNITWPAPVS